MGLDLQPYNDPKHTSHMCKNYLRGKQEKGDLIENLWDHLKREKVKHDPINKDNLWDVLNQ